MSHRHSYTAKWSAEDGMYVASAPCCYQSMSVLDATAEAAIAELAELVFETDKEIASEHPDYQ
jgi:hypothetical protein